MEEKTVHLDPDAQVQNALRVLFATFKRTASAWATVKYFRDQGLLFPHRVRTGPHAGTIHWSALTHNGVLKILRNPRYAGAFCYGRTHTSKGLDGSLHVETVPQEEWPFLFQDVHVGYITWQEFEANRQQLQQNRQVFGGDRKHGPAREGPALLQGLVICGKCGNRMTVRYHQAEHGTRLIPEYVCQKERIEQATEQTCQHILGAGLDTTIADLLLAQMTPFTLDTAQQVYEELHAQVEAAQRLRDQQVERARYAAELAQRRFVRVDPEIDWWPLFWKPNGMPVYTNTLKFSRKSKRNRNKNNVASLHWNARPLRTLSKIFHASGTMNEPPTETANAWCVCCLRM